MSFLTAVYTHSCLHVTSWGLRCHKCNLRLAIDVFMAYPLEVFAFKLTILDSPDVSGVLCSEFNVIRQGSLI